MSWKYEGTCSAEKEYVCGKEDGFYIKYVEFSLASASAAATLVKVSSFSWHADSIQLIPRKIPHI